MSQSNYNCSRTRQFTALSTFALISATMLFGLFSCNHSNAIDVALNQKLQGCWVGGLLKNGILTEDIELRYFTLRPDTSLELSLIYEIGPRSRVWEYDTDIACKDHEISWLAHHGRLSENLDSMFIVKNWNGETSEWLFYRDSSYDTFIQKFLSNRANQYIYSIPEKIQDGIEVGNLTEAGIDTSKIFGFMDRIKSGKYGDIHSVLIYRSGKLLLEDYFALNGQFSGTFINESFRNKIHQLSSVTKGILSLDMGMAIDQGYINHPEDPISKYLLTYKDYFKDEKKEIQINHLFTMTSGIEWNQFNYAWNDNRNDAANMYKCDNVIEYVLSRPIAAKPGVKFNYTNGEPTVLGEILHNACGSEVDIFTHENLFKPLDIREYHWSRYPDGTIETDGGLKLRSRDLLKIGILLLNHGIWNDKPLVSEVWLAESIQPKIHLSSKRGYGYYWNTMQYPIGELADTATFIPGDGGQILAIFPSIDMVIVFTAGIYDKDPTSFYWKLLRNEILPAVQLN